MERHHDNDDAGGEIPAALAAVLLAVECAQLAQAGGDSLPDWYLPLTRSIANLASAVLAAESPD
jgi:hypothetical protein